MWWRDGVLYQVYPRSFADSDGDGIGDLRGITAHLDHLEWLGVDGLWLNPTFPSPNADWGFDVSDYCGVHPDLGTLEDLDELVARAGERGIKVLLDLVPNHTSDQHPWFRERRDFYVWREGRNGGPPNNWMSNFGGPGVDARRGQRPVVPAQLHARSARPRLVERGRARGLRRHPALLDGPRHRGLSHRRGARDRQGPRAARQPAGHRGRHRAPPLAGPAARVLDEPRRGPRRLPPLARGVRPLRRRAAGRDVGPRPRAPDALLRRRPRRAAPGLQLRLPAGRLRDDAAGADRGRDRGAAARARVADVDARQPRHGALPNALDARRPRPRRGARS